MGGYGSQQQLFCCCACVRCGAAGADRMDTKRALLSQRGSTRKCRKTWCCLVERGQAVLSYSDPQRKSFPPPLVYVVLSAAAFADAGCSPPWVQARGAAVRGVRDAGQRFHRPGELPLRRPREDALPPGVRERQRRPLDRFSGSCCCRAFFFVVVLRFCVRCLFTSKISPS